MRKRLTHGMIFVIAFLFTLAQSVSAKPDEKPNILIVMVDQQFSDAMSCMMGNKYINTPNMDLLVEKGVRFSRAYSPNPLCMPMRTSMLSGKFPHQTGVMANEKSAVLLPDENVFMGKLIKDAGYETGYFGKWHITFDEKETEIHGFDKIDINCQQYPVPQVTEFIKQKHDKPFFAFASFNSPHEICEWSRFSEVPGGPIGDVPALNTLPPLKSNFLPQKNEPEIMAFMRKSYQAHRLFPVGSYSEEDWRRLQWGYYRLIERADRYLGELMLALKEAGQDKNTLVLLMADHGDCAGSHHWNQKTVFYDESVRVPFVVMWDGKTKKTTCSTLVNVGTDLIPTLCEIAGADIPSQLQGKSMGKLIFGDKPDWERDYVVSENRMIQCEPVDGKLFKPQGRMVCSQQYKYCIYSEGENSESLVDLKNDPGEMVNQANNPDYKKVLDQHRNYLREHAESTNDKKALEMLQAIR